jgi:ActR/RegA family two-component response regulator
MGKPTLLLVEDDGVLLEYLARTLDEWGYEVFSASTGTDAVKTARGRFSTSPSWISTCPG